jgi:hypothetical protein
MTARPCFAANSNDSLIVLEITVSSEVVRCLPPGYPYASKSLTKSGLKIWQPSARTPGCCQRIGIQLVRTLLKEQVI